jgi:hypothetical protein
MLTAHPRTKSPSPPAGHHEPTTTKESCEPNQINQLPRNVRKNDNDKFKCEPTNGRKVSMDGKYCGGYHSLSVHLDYVGHAALTDRLLEVDPEWSWEPMAVGQDGLPAFDREGGLWIKLSICGVTRLGYGDAQGKSGANAVKEAIGDALRNAGMRFGAALDLWHKGDLQSAADEKGSEEAPALRTAPATEPPATAIASPAKVDWNALYLATAGDRGKLEALRHSAKSAGAPDDFWLFAKIETALNPAPLEGKVA